MSGFRLSRANGRESVIRSDVGNSLPQKCASAMRLGHAATPAELARLAFLDAERIGQPRLGRAWLQRLLLARVRAPAGQGSAPPAIPAAFVFVRMDVHLDAVPAEVLALSQAVQVILLWSDTAFVGVSPLVDAGGGVALRPEIGALIRAGYDRILPAMARDAAHGLRLAARVMSLI